MFQTVNNRLPQGLVEYERCQDTRYGPICGVHLVQKHRRLSASGRDYVFELMVATLMVWVSAFFYPRR